MSIITGHCIKTHNWAAGGGGGGDTRNLAMNCVSIALIIQSCFSLA